MSLGERDHLEDLGVDGKIILNWMLQAVGWGRVDWSVWLRTGLLRTL